MATNTVNKISPTALPASQPVRISFDLLESARRDAALEGRSLQAQLEYWATLGRAVDETPGRARAVLAARAGFADLARVDAALRAEIHIDDLNPAERSLYLERLDAWMEDDTANYNSPFYVALRAEGGWCAEDDGTLYHLNGDGEIDAIEQPADQGG